MNTNNLAPLRWYQRFGGIMMAGIGITVLVIFLFIGGTTWYYYRQIKSGNGALLFQKFYGGFTADVKNDSKVGKIDRAEIELNSAPYLGSSNPQVTIVEFVDFKCTNSKAEAPILRQMMQKYGNKVKLIIRNFPVESTHPGASQLSALAVCAFEQGNYWPVHDWLFDNQAELVNVLSETDIVSIAQNFGMDEEKLKICMKSNDAKVVVNKDYVDGYRFGINGTPTFFINGEKIEGAVPYNAWEMFFQNLK